MAFRHGIWTVHAPIVWTRHVFIFPREKKSLSLCLVCREKNKLGFLRRSRAHTKRKKELHAQLYCFICSFLWFLFVSLVKEFPFFPFLCTYLDPLFCLFVCFCSLASLSSYTSLSFCGFFFFAVLSCESFARSQALSNWETESLFLFDYLSFVSCFRCADLWICLSAPQVWTLVYTPLLVDLGRCSTPGRVENHFLKKKEERKQLSEAARAWNRNQKAKFKPDLCYFWKRIFAICFSLVWELGKEGEE